jgi:hypothetical protein
LDVEMTEYQENMNLQLSMFDADTSFHEVASIDSLFVTYIVLPFQLFVNFIKKVVPRLVKGACPKYQPRLSYIDDVDQYQLANHIT